MVVINFDDSPIDTLWEISVGDVLDDDFGQTQTAASSPFYDNADYIFGTAKHTVCLPGRQAYTFTIRDGMSNGIKGNGGYMILLKEGNSYEVIVEGDGKFEWTESKTFDLTGKNVQVASPRMGSYARSEDV